MVRKKIAAAAIVVVTMLAAPLSAQAVNTDVGPYVPSSSIEVTFLNTLVDFRRFYLVSFLSSSFNPLELVSFRLSGEGASSATLAVVETSLPFAKQAGSDGSVPLNVTLPVGARGTYQVVATGGTSGRVGTATITVVPADDGSALPNTGSEVPVLGLWAGGGVVVLGIALVIAAVSRRRKQAG